MKQGFKCSDAPQNSDCSNAKFGELLWLVFLTSCIQYCCCLKYLFFHHQRNKLNCSPAMKCRIDLGAPLNAFLCLWVVEVHCKIPPFHTSSAKNLKCSCECWCYYSCILSMRIFSHTWLFSASTGCSFVRVHLPLQHTEQSSWKELLFRWLFFLQKKRLAMIYLLPSVISVSN